MTNLLKDSANRNNKHIYQVLLESVKGQYDQANERMYLKQKQDTAAFFNLIRRMYTIAETLDSLDQRPNKRGKLKPEYRQRYATMLHGYRSNLFSGGTFFIRKNKWKEAFDFMHTYIDCARQPLFTAYNYTTTDKRLPEAAYWATYSGYKLNDPAITLQHSQLAQDDSLHTQYALQFIAEALKWQGDEGSYVATLEQGFHRYPLFSYFFPRLIDIYIQRQQYEKALQLADEALQQCDTCQLFLFAKSSALLRLQRWEESVAFSEQLIHHHESMPEPYFNAASAYLSMAEKLDAQEDKEQQRTYYQKARTYMEYYRKLMPNEKGKWAPVLYRIYLNLNLGRQFDEIDKLLKE